MRLSGFLIPVLRYERSGHQYLLPQGAVKVDDLGMWLLPKVVVDGT